MFPKYFLLIIVAAVVATFLMWPSFATGSQLGEFTGKVGRPDINDHGWVTWMGHDGHDYEIFLSDGIKTTQLTDNNFSDRYPDINNNGWVTWHAWDGHDYEVFLYDGKKVVQFTNNSRHDSDPQLNNNNWIVWQGPMDILLYDGSSITQVVKNMAPHGISFSDNGHIAWEGGYPWSIPEIWLYHEGKTVQLTHNEVNEFRPRVNKKGQVTWAGRDGGAFYTFFYDGNSIIKLGYLGRDGPGRSAPEINDNGWVVWGGVSLYDGSKVVSLPTSGHAERPIINNNNVISWIGWDGDREIMLYDWQNVYKLTDNDYDDWHPEMGSFGVNKPNQAATSLGAGRRSLEFNAANAPQDSIKPKANVRVPRISTSLSKRPKFRVGWAGFDPGFIVWKDINNNIVAGGESGIKSYTAKYRKAGSSTWTNLWANTTSKSIYFKGRAGNTYDFKVDVTDKAGNIGSSKGRRTIVPYDQTAGAIFKSRRGFSYTLRKPTSKYYKGTVRYSKKRGDSITYRFNGNKVYLISTKYKNRSKAKIYLDKRLVKTVDTKSKTFKPRAIIYSKSFSKKGKHTLKIVNLATKGRRRLDVDGVGVGL